MPLNELAVPERVVGEREIRRALSKCMLRKIFVAADSDARVVRGLLEVAAKQEVEVERVDSKQKLGRACAINRAASVAGLLKN